MSLDKYAHGRDSPRGVRWNQNLPVLCLELLLQAHPQTFAALEDTRDQTTTNRVQKWTRWHSDYGLTSSDLTDKTTVYLLDRWFWETSRGHMTLPGVPGAFSPGKRFETGAVMQTISRARWALCTGCRVWRRGLSRDIQWRKESCIEGVQILRLSTQVTTQIQL
jgi:hypothetical protein